MQNLQDDWWVQNVNYNNIEKVMFWQQCKEAKVQVHAEFTGWLVNAECELQQHGEGDVLAAV